MTCVESRKTQRVVNDKGQYRIENSDSRDLGSHLEMQVSRQVTFA